MFKGGDELYKKAGKLPSIKMRDVLPMPPVTSKWTVTCHPTLVHMRYREN